MVQISIPHTDVSTRIKWGIENWHCQQPAQRKKEVDFRCARHKELYDEVNGNIMYCAECYKTMSTVDIVNNSIKRWRDTDLSNERAKHNRPDTNIPLSPARLDMAAYTFT